MSTIGFAVNSETLLALGWASRLPGLREELERKQKSLDSYEQALRARVSEALPPAFTNGSLTGQVYASLFEHRLSRVQFMELGWAIRGYNAVYLAGAHTQGQDAAEEEASEETGVLWQAISRSERLLARLTRMTSEWQQDLRGAGRLLRFYFTAHLPLLDCSFIVYEFLSLSMERVNWAHLAALVLGVPHTPQQQVQEAEEEQDGVDGALAFALLKELIWQGYVEFGEISLNARLSRQVHECCLSLADTCFQAHEEITELASRGQAFTQPGEVDG